MAKYEKGDHVMYTSNMGEIDIGIVINIHYDDTPPYYTIRLQRTGAEKVTDEKNLTLMEEEEEREEIEKEEEKEEKIIEESKQENQKSQKRVQKRVKSKTQQKKGEDSKTKSDSLIQNQALNWTIAGILALSLGIYFSYNIFGRSFSFPKSSR
jgi:hypothetical protein